MTTALVPREPGSLRNKTGTAPGIHGTPPESPRGLPGDQLGGPSAPPGSRPGLSPEATAGILGLPRPPVGKAGCSTGALRLEDDKRNSVDYGFQMSCALRMRPLGKLLPKLNFGYYF